ncbi:MAG TPA: hypothetical protein VMG30_06970 [Acidobacteriota bacterium]|nr:hypothetical protein [Acidobacteriota bacterium]
MSIDISKTVRLPITGPFKEILKTDYAEFIPLTRTTTLPKPSDGAESLEEMRRRTAEYGWCTYNSTIRDLPEVEIMSGGLNEKTVEGAAIWRQGNLLEFGFEASPGKMNETGRAMLVNSIVYIAKFTQDRPIVKVPMTATKRVPPRTSLLRYAADETMPLSFLQEYLAKETIAAAPGKDRESYKRWLPTVLPYLHPDDALKYRIDAEALLLGIRFDQPDFSQKMIEKLRSDGSEAKAARILLARYIPDGPGAAADAGAWESWIQQHSQYMFFSEMGGLRWYIDPLALKRHIPTASLRGPARADIADKNILGKRRS